MSGDLAAVGREMRAAQREYFTTRSDEALKRAKDLEKQFDLLLVPPSGPQRPQRRFVLKAAIGADSIEEIDRALTEIAEAVVAENSRGYVQGGPSLGYHFEVIEDPEMTPEKYREQLAAYLKHLKTAATPIAAAVAKQGELFEGSQTSAKPGHAS